MRARRADRSPSPPPESQGEAALVSPGSQADESDLVGVLSEFARTMATDFAIQGILDHLVRRIVDVLPVTAAGVTLIAPGIQPRYIAASNDSALPFEQLQTELDEGPCLAAYHSGAAVAIPDLRDDDGFPNSHQGPRGRAWRLCSPSRSITTITPGGARPLPRYPGPLAPARMVQPRRSPTSPPLPAQRPGARGSRGLREPLAREPLFTIR